MRQKPNLIEYRHHQKYLSVIISCIYYSSKCILHKTRSGESWGFIFSLCSATPWARSGRKCADKGARRGPAVLLQQQHHHQPAACLDRRWSPPPSPPSPLPFPRARRWRRCQRLRSPCCGIRSPILLLRSPVFVLWLQIGEHIIQFSIWSNQGMLFIKTVNTYYLSSQHLLASHLVSWKKILIQCLIRTRATRREATVPYSLTCLTRTLLLRNQSWLAGWKSSPCRLSASLLTPPPSWSSRLASIPTLLRN